MKEIAAAPSPTLIFVKYPPRFTKGRKRVLYAAPRYDDGVGWLTESRLPYLTSRILRPVQIIRVARVPESERGKYTNQLFDVFPELIETIEPINQQTE